MLRLESQCEAQDLHFRKSIALRLESKCEKPNLHLRKSIALRLESQCETQDLHLRKSIALRLESQCETQDQNNATVTASVSEQTLNIHSTSSQIRIFFLKYFIQADKLKNLQHTFQMIKKHVIQYF